MLNNMSSKDVSLRLDLERSRVEMQLVEYGTSSISAVSILASECVDSCTSAPLCLEYGVISEPVAPTVGVEQQLVQYVNWDSLEIDETLDDEGRIQVMSDEQLFAFLALRNEERAKTPAHVASSSNGVETNGPGVLEGIEGAAIPVDDTVPDELVISYDKNNPCMDRGTKYPSMKEFRLAVRQFAIKKEFELGKVKRSVGRQRKLRIKGCLETGGKNKKIIRGPVTCKRCGEKGHRKRKPRKNSQKNYPPEPSTPKRTTNKATIMQESPGMVTRRRLTMLLGGTNTSGLKGAREMASTSGGPSIPKKKKMTPKKMKTS